ncbi:hypothetical protein [Rhodovulum marinum]|uniref:Uncharacterized protein n=1 Tax=Rhodovulum marinum TaxID=320662 RepID=A0A4R2Q2K6_9RHOB|nr:hypothetical protein [Rhodovulum marinum]TCP41878.1 hypothetical protein EV662_104222 [Rhodovulum marinum]
MTTVLMLIVALSSPAALSKPPACTPVIRNVAGQEIYCCTTVKGEQCCSPSLDNQGQPTGCDCRPN